MPSPELVQLGLDIDRVLRIEGGEPLVTAQDLNGLLHSLADTLAPAPAFDRYALSAALRTEVVLGTYNASGELTDALSAAAAAESRPGQCFSYGPALYTFLPGDAGTPVWVRTWKGAAPAAASPAPAANATTTTPATPGLEVLAVARVEGTLSANGFNTIALNQTILDVRPAGSSGGWNTATQTYAAPVSGTYELQTSMRIHDAYGPLGSNYALGAGPSNVDGAWMYWNTIFDVHSGTNRKGLQVTRLLHLKAGEEVRMYAYLDGFDAFVFGEFTVKLLRRDDPPVAVL